MAWNKRTKILRGGKMIDPLDEEMEVEEAPKTVTGRAQSALGVPKGQSPLSILLEKRKKKKNER